MLDFMGKKVLVIGMARSGQAAARFLSNMGALVTGADIKEESDLGEGLRGLKALPIELITGCQPELKPGQYDLAIVSPGVPLTIPPVQAAERLGIPVWSELELAARFIREPIIAVTGTNGKTTTTALTGYIFQRAGQEVVVAGNIGIPLIGEVERTLRQKISVDYWIVEVSSFQLERAYEFRPHIAALLNLTSDHLDRHSTLEEYGRVKARIFRNQEPDDHAVLNLDDPWIANNIGFLPGQTCWFSTQKVPEAGIGVEDGAIIFNGRGIKESLCPVQSVRIPGLHNLENVLAASSAALLAGIDREAIAEALSTFPGVPHRLEPVDVIDGVKYVNDSKGTNPESVLKALESYQEPIILIAGGKNKGSDFAMLAGKIKTRVKALILLGQAAPLIEQAVRAVGYSAVWNVITLEDGVKTAARLAQSGDVVLLSPACASWDMFRDYEERGDLFNKLVLELGSPAKEVEQ